MRLSLVCEQGKQVALMFANDFLATNQAMYKAIASLSKIDKALVMLYLEDYPYDEIGNMLGITPNNVAVKMNRIKIKLKDESKKHYQFA